MEMKNNISLSDKFSDEFYKATKDPQLMENLLADEEFHRMLIERDNNIYDLAVSAGRQEGKIELYFTEMKFSAVQIAEKLSMDEGSIIAVLKKIGLV